MYASVQPLLTVVETLVMSVAAETDEEKGHQSLEIDTESDKAESEALIQKPSAPPTVIVSTPPAELISTGPGIPTHANNSSIIALVRMYCWNEDGPSAAFCISFWIFCSISMVRRQLCWMLYIGE